MKSMKKALLLVLCAALLVSATVFGTLAYLTDSEAVTNTFTIGKIKLTLDEAPVDPNGDAIEGEDRVQENDYHLLPGHDYDKDPIVHVKNDSENSYVFITVENGIAAIESKEAGYKSIAQQILDNGWTLLDGETNVYYKEWFKPEAPVDEYTDLPVFASFKIDGTSVTADVLADYEGAEVNITAYAIQRDVFANAAEAWAAGNAQQGGWATDN